MTPAAAATYSVDTYGPKAGEEIAPGVREVFLARRDVTLASYKIVWMTDLVFQPGASTPEDVTANDMVVQMLDGLLRVRLDEEELCLKRGDLWAFPKGARLAQANTGADVAVLRVIDLLPGF
jgi:quercetin dioxygenase-like cupin family protein